jgi:hypothetical protein
VSAQLPRIYDAGAVAVVLLPPRTTTYRTRAEVPRSELYLDMPGTPHHDHRPVTPELGARLICGLEHLDDDFEDLAESVSTESYTEGNERDDQRRMAVAEVHGDRDVP